MRGSSSWNYRPYARLTDAVPTPYICAVRPLQDGFTVSLLGAGDSNQYELHYAKYQSLEPATCVPFQGAGCSVGGLETEQDYSLRVLHVPSQAFSNTRLVRTGSVPGTVVNYLHPLDEQYAFSGRSLCSPSIAVLPSGRLIASMDVFTGGGPQNLSLLFVSDDGGESWQYLNDLFPCFWGKLFVHRGGLYMLAHATEYGDLLIGCSMDEGRTWSKPVHILPGSGSSLDAGPHKAPMPIMEHRGRLFTGLDYGAWKRGGHASAVLSIAADADLMEPSNWTCSPFLPYDSHWPGAAQGQCGGLLEGNVLVCPEQGIVNLLRYNMRGAAPAYGKAAMLRMPDPFGNPEAALQFETFVSWNGGSNSKFLALRDEKSGRYVALANEITDPKAPAARNVLTLYVSDNLEAWKPVHRVVDYRRADPAFVGFQYPDMVIHGEDLLCLSRTAFNRARNFHDANFICFHRIKDFRALMDLPALPDALPGT